jgi:hypothetical protein
VASPFVLDRSGLPSSAESGRIPTSSIQNLILRPYLQELPCLFCSTHFSWVHQKELLSNLGLTVFVRHLWLIWLSRFLYVGSGLWEAYENLTQMQLCQIICKLSWHSPSHRRERAQLCPKIWRLGLGTAPCCRTG